MDADRRQRFIAWFNGPPCRGDREALITRTGYTKGRISQFFDDDQPFGERAARELARRLGMADDNFFNVPIEASASWPFKLVTWSEIASLNEVELAVVEGAMLVALQQRKNHPRHLGKVVVIPDRRTGGGGRQVKGGLRSVASNHPLRRAEDKKTGEG